MMDRRNFLKYVGVAGVGAALLKVNPALAAPNPLRLWLEGKSLEGKSKKNNTFNVLFDSWSSQVLFQQAPDYYPAGVKHPQVTGRRLNTILGAMKSYGLVTEKEWNVSFTGSRVTKDKLKGVDVYVSLTREINQPINPNKPSPFGTGFSYDDRELRALEDFVRQGGGILLMSDHGALPPKDPNWTENDAALASIFGVTLENYFVTYTPPNARGYMVMEMTPNLSGDLVNLSYQVHHISSHDSCIINIKPTVAFTPLAKFHDGSTAYDPATGQTISFADFPSYGLSPYFSILVPFGTGKVIVVGNSGMLGDYGSPDPAPGIVNLENNLMFFLNCVAYLGGFTCTKLPDPGYGPKC
jgi:hypothetical protein